MNIFQTVKEAVAALEEQRTSLEQENAEAVQMNETLHGQIADAGSELEAVAQEIADVEVKIEADRKKAEAAQKKLSVMTANVKQAENYAAEYTHDPDEWLPEPLTMESAKSYRKRIIPLIRKVIEIIRPLYAFYLEMKRGYEQIKARVKNLNGRIAQLYRRLSSAEEDNARLKEQLRDYDRVETILGKDTIDDAVRKAKLKEQIFCICEGFIHEGCIAGLNADKVKNCM